MGRNNADFYNNVKDAALGKKITVEEAYDLAGSDARTSHDTAEHPLGPDLKPHRPDTPRGKSEFSRKTARRVHKNAGLTVDPKKGY